MAMIDPPPCSIVLERPDDRDGLRLYLGGDLQFDTADEAIYHERLAHPAAIAALARFPGSIDALVLGGGDGLLVRELLRHDRIGSIRVVDLDPRVVRLGRGELAPYNGGSLDDPRVRVTIGDARDPADGRWQLIVSDLTFPTTPDDCRMLSRDAFVKLRDRIHPGGVLALNAVSPEQTPAAYWGIYQALRAAAWQPLPGHFDLPSFRDLGYGRWGFLLASDRPIQPAELLEQPMPKGLRTLDPDRIADCFRMPSAWAALRESARPAVDEGRILFDALRDAAPAPGFDPAAPEFDFLKLVVDRSPIPDPGPVATIDHPRLRDWLARRPGSGIDDLLAAIPIGHRIVTRELIRDWSAHLLPVLQSIDLKRLVSALLRRAAALPGQVVAELRRFRSWLARGLNPADDPLTWGWRFFSILMLVLVLSQTAMPTAAYGKGFGGGSSFHFGSSSSSRYRSGSTYRSGHGSPADAETLRRILGGFLTAGGVGIAGYSARRRSD